MKIEARMRGVVEEMLVYVGSIRDYVETQNRAH